MGALTVSRSDLISDAYLGEQVRLHMQPRGYGQRGGKWHISVRYLAQHFGCASVLDYGCGQGGLAAALVGSGLDVREYDPAVFGKEARPTFADLVVATDVLEHIELEKLPNVLNHIRGLARKAMFFVVALDATSKTLSDGRNAHILQRPDAWWLANFDQHHFRVVTPAALPIPLTPEKAKKRVIAVCLP